MPYEWVVGACRIGTSIPLLRFDVVDAIKDSGGGCSQLRNVS